MPAAEGVGWLKLLYPTSLLARGHLESYREKSWACVCMRVCACVCVCEAYAQESRHRWWSRVGVCMCSAHSHGQGRGHAGCGLLGVALLSGCFWAGSGSWDVSVTAKRLHQCLKKV